MRIKDQQLRRAESEIDSQNFRNKQLERRIESLQNDLQAKTKGSGGGNKTAKVRDNQWMSGNGEIDPIVAEELQRRIIENAQLASTVGF
jgi:capsule polysaccharide export protein KpsE/RkpR